MRGWASIMAPNTAREATRNERIMDNYRRKSDGHIVRAHQVKNGDWLLQEDAASMFHGVNNWYFQREYELVEERPAKYPPDTEYEL